MVKKKKYQDYKRNKQKEDILLDILLIVVTILWTALFANAFFDLFGIPYSFLLSFCALMAFYFLGVLVVSVSVLLIEEKLGGGLEYIRHWSTRDRLRLEVPIAFIITLELTLKTLLGLVVVFIIALLIGHEPQDLLISISTKSKAIIGFTVGFIHFIFFAVNPFERAVKLPSFLGGPLFFLVAWISSRSS